MLGDIVVFSLVWIILVPVLAFKLRRKLPASWGKAKRIALWVGVFTLPYLEEIYYEITFEIACATHTGLVKNEKVVTDSIQVPYQGVFSLLNYLVEHKGIRYVFVHDFAESREQRQTYLLNTPWLSAKKSMSACTSAVHVHLKSINPSLAELFEARGECLDDSMQSFQPEYRIYFSRISNDVLAPPFPKGLSRGVMGVENTKTLTSPMVFIELEQSTQVKSVFSATFFGFPLGPRSCLAEHQLIKKSKPDVQGIREAFIANINLERVTK